jgi:hypothetical protein
VLGNKRLHVSTRTGNVFAWDTQPEYRAGVAKRPAKKKTAANLNRQKLPLVPRVRKPGEKQSKYANGTRLRIFWDGDGVWYMGQAFHGPGFQHVPRAGFLGSKTAIMQAAMAKPNSNLLSLEGLWAGPLPAFRTAAASESHDHFATMRGADPRYLSSPSAAGVMYVDQDQLTAGDFD